MLREIFNSSCAAEIPPVSKTRTGSGASLHVGARRRPSITDGHASASPTVRLYRWELVKENHCDPFWLGQARWKLLLGTVIGGQAQPVAHAGFLLAGPPLEERRSINEGPKAKFSYPIGRPRSSG